MPALRAKLAGRVQTESGVPVAAAPAQEIPFQVAARDPERLAAICEGLSRRVMGENAEEAENAAFALSYVRDPVAVPYLRQILKQAVSGREDAIAGLVRIGSSEPVEVLRSSSDTQDKELKSLIQNALSEIKTRHP